MINSGRCGLNSADKRQSRGRGTIRYVLNSRTPRSRQTATGQSVEGREMSEAARSAANDQTSDNLADDSDHVIGCRVLRELGDVEEFIAE